MHVGLVLGNMAGGLQQLSVLLLQVELHPLLAQRKLVGVSYRKGVVSVAHSCLVRQAAEIQDSPLVQQVAAETGKTINQVSERWGRRVTAGKWWG
jgi:diketogulonate reductase-like aldo/keto reductase